MRNDCNLVIVKDQSSLIYVPGFDKNDAVSKFPLHFFFTVFVFFSSRVLGSEMWFSSLKAVLFGMQVLQVRGFFPLSLLSEWLCFCISPFISTFPSVLRCSIAICALKSTQGPCFSTQVSHKPAQVCVSSGIGST